MALRPGPAVLGALAGVAGHLLAFGAGLVAGAIARPSPGGGFEDLAAAVVTFLAAQLLVALVCLVGGVVLVVRGRRELGYGLVAGWVLGAVAAWLVLRVA